MNIFVLKKQLSQTIGLLGLICNKCSVISLHSCLVLTISTPNAFSAAFSPTELSLPIESTTLPSIGHDELVNFINNVCSEILENVAPFKMRYQINKNKNKMWMSNK